MALIEKIMKTDTNGKLYLSNLKCIVDALGKIDLEHKELRDCKMVEDGAVLYFKNGDYILKAFEEERKEQNGTDRKYNEN